MTDLLFARINISFELDQHMVRFRLLAVSAA